MRQDTGRDPAAQKWHQILVVGHEDKPASYLPGSPRCSMCEIPMGGVGGFLLKTLKGRAPSRKNPHMCNIWDDILPPGGAEIDIAVMFADVRGSTAIAEKMGPSAFAELLNRFYLAAQHVLIPRRAVIDKMIGDEVMAFFIPSFEPEYRRRSVEAAIQLQRALMIADDGKPLLPVGIGVHAGRAYVGKVGSDISDFTAIGDTVNTASRLQAAANAGEVVISGQLANVVPAEFEMAESRSIAIRGRGGEMDVKVLKIG